MPETRPETRLVKPPRAIPVAIGADGLLRIGAAGHIRLDPANPDFAAAVVAALARVAETPGGAAILRQGGTAGRPVTIAKPYAATEPPNAWTLPDDPRAATAPGQPTGERDAAGNPILGSGTGCGSTIAYDPADWTGQGGTRSAEEVLLTMLAQANSNAGGSSAGAGGGPAAPAGTPPPADLRLRCRPGKSGNRLTFQYTLHNAGPVELYVMDAIPSLDPATREPRADDQAAVVILGPEGDVILGKFVAPLPCDRHMALTVLPLARLLPPDGTLERQLAIPLPLAETSPYFADLPLRRYEIVDIKGVVFTIGYWVAGVDNLAAAPVEGSPELFAVVTRNTARSARRATQRFPTTGLQLFKRSDAFPRTLG